MTFANPILPNTQSEDSACQKFKTPEELGYKVACGLLFCGHLDGHDVYRHAGSDDFVLVYGNDTEAVFSSTLQKAYRWLAENNGTEWGTMRAIVKGRRELVRQIDDVIARLNHVKNKHGDHNSFGVFVCDTCFDAVDLLETFKEGAGL